MSRRASALSPLELRGLVRDALPEGSSEYGTEPPLHQLFVPKSHARALHLNIPLVVGSRGTGKSFWWNVLQSEEHRALVEKHAPDTRIKRSTVVRPGFGPGFGKRADLDRYPSRDALAALLGTGRTAREVWKAVMVWAVLEVGDLPSLSSWSERVAWVAEQPERVDRLVQARDRALYEAENDLLVVFDALDWTSDDWDEVYRLVDGLLQVALEFRACRRIRAKVFLRNDQFDRRRIARFPDASKLVASHVRLHWLTTELYGLLWQLLAFHPAKGSNFRQFVFDQVVRNDERGKALAHAEDWQLPPAVHFDSDVQERLFHSLTDRFMGDSARRGFPYKWLPTHLADAHGEVTPRSFIVALRTAAEHTMDHHAGWGFALHYRSLHAGLQEASAVRVDEIGEHGWVPEVMAGLKDHLLVPFAFDELEARWRCEGTLDSIREQQEAEIAAGRMEKDEQKPWLLPAHLDDGAAGVRDDLETLGVFRKMRDGRIDVPDVYRLGFGLRRKGGVAPQRRGR